MSISFSYVGSKTVEVFKGVFHSPDHDPELNHDQWFLDNPTLSDRWINLSPITPPSDLLGIMSRVTHHGESQAEPISNFQSGGANGISSNEDSVKLTFTNNEITEDTYDQYTWKLNPDKKGATHTFDNYEIRAEYYGMVSDQELSIPIEITNDYPTADITILDSEGMKTKPQPTLTIDSEEFFFTIRLGNIFDTEAGDYLYRYFDSEWIHYGDAQIKNSLSKLIILVQNGEIVNSLDLPGFRLNIKTSGIEEEFTLDLNYTMDNNQLVNPQTSISLQLVDPIELVRPDTSVGINMLTFYKDLVTLEYNASNPTISFVFDPDDIIVRGEKYPGFTEGDQVFDEIQSGETKYIDIPMSIYVPTIDVPLTITPYIETDYTYGKVPHYALGMASEAASGFPLFDEEFQMTNENHIHTTSNFVLRIHMQEYWNGRFSVTIKCQIGNIGTHTLAFPHDFIVTSVNSKVIVTGAALGG